MKSFVASANAWKDSIFKSVLKDGLNETLQGLGRFGLLVGKTLAWGSRRPWRYGRFLEEIERIGFDSLPIVVLVGLFTGMVFALQSGYSFAAFHAETLVGQVVAVSLTREIGPVFTALMLVARTGSAMAAEIGTMAVSEQVDALEVMAVNPVQYLVVPRMLASCLVYPLLTVLFNVTGIIGAYWVGIHLLHIPEGPFLERLHQAVALDDLWGGLFKAWVFGFFVSLICCYQGLHATRGAAGVGMATTKAVVYSSVCVLISDYFLTSWVLEFIKD